MQHFTEWWWHKLLLFRSKIKYFSKKAPGMKIPNSMIKCTRIIFIFSIWIYIPGSRQQKKLLKNVCGFTLTKSYMGKHIRNISIKVLQQTVTISKIPQCGCLTLKMLFAIVTEVFHLLIIELILLKRWGIS